MNTETKPSTYQVVTGQITTILQQGKVPWAEPWTAAPPRNYVSGARYRGVNAVLLRAAQRSTPAWLTRRQLEGHECQPVRGQRPSLATFWKRDEGAERATLLFYPVYNWDQCEGLPDWERLPRPEKPYELADRLIANMPCKPKHTRAGDGAYYVPAEDRINIPKQSKFAGLNAYYSAWFHELIHCTRHASRLNRTYRQEPETPLHCGHCDYSREELVAEIGTAMLAAETGIVHAPGGDAAGWLKVLQADEKLFVHAAAHAQRAVDSILGRNAPAQTPELAVGTAN